jgi:hypothetical protein
VERFIAPRSAVFSAPDQAIETGDASDLAGSVLKAWFLTLTASSGSEGSGHNGEIHHKGTMVA